jgi:RNA polymerase sigma-70 factor (ECF subfamily)
MATALENISPELIHSAQLGEKDSVDRLVELVKEHLFAYIYRLTLDYELTQDLLQETILFMIQSINQLESSDQFWPWLFRNAMGKVQHYYRERKRRRSVELTEALQMKIHHHISSDVNDGLTELLRKELSDAVFRAMKRIKLEYRNILVLRCFEDMPYSEIAMVLNCSEIQSRVLFCRAKNSLRRQLAANGLGGRYFLLALALFELATASAKTTTTATITAASLEVGLLPTLLASFFSKIGLFFTAEVIAMAMALPLQMFLYAMGIACLAGLCIYLICLIGTRNN